MPKGLPDLSAIFARYEALAADADAVFARMRVDFPAAIACREGCSACCHALFDLPLVEAAYLNRAFNAAYPHGLERSGMLEKADQADRAIHKIKRRAFREEQAGTATSVILEGLGREKIRCPLLTADASGEGAERCALYAARPLTCRLYGLPTAIDGKGHACALSGFDPGQRYPTVKMETLYARLASLSLDLARRAGSGYSRIHTVLVPVSMALLTSYDAAYYGLELPAAYPAEPRHD
jgi:Fe-S-cluster containining protein